MTPQPDTAVPELDELTITIVVDNTTDTLSSISPGIPQLPEIAYLLGGVPSGQHDGHDCVTTFDQLCVACHGFSALATARQETKRQPSCSTSAPTATSGWPTPNGSRSTCPASTCCSCRTGTGTTPAASHRCRRDRRCPSRSAGRPPLVVDVHPDRPDQRGILTPFDNFAMLPPEPTFEAIEAAGGDVVTHADEHAVAGLFLASGDIPRQTSYETGLAGHHTWRGDEVTLDPEIHDERFLAANVARPRNDRAHRLFTRRRRQRRTRSPTTPSRTNPSTSCSAATTSPAPPSRIASTRPCATSKHSSTLESSPPGTAPAGEQPPPSPTHSARPATPRASAGAVFEYPLLVRSDRWCAVERRASGQGWLRSMTFAERLMSHRCSTMAPTDRTTIATGIHGLTLSSPVITSAMVAIVTATIAATTTMTLRRRWRWMVSTIVSTTGSSILLPRSRER